MRALIELVNDLWTFLRVRKRFWVLPVVLALLLVAALAAWLTASAVSPFIYTLF
jgi:hypothetical protein